MSFDVRGPKGPKSQTMPKQKLQDHETHSSKGAISGYDHEPKADPSVESKMAPHHEAKKNVLGNLSNLMKRHMGESIKDHLAAPRKSVTVEAPDAVGLKKGLDLASQLSPSIDKLSSVAGDIIGKGNDDEERDMDEAAMDSEESSNEMPEDHAELSAEHRDQDDDNEDAMDELKKHLAKKA